jgi:hypothetical protein
MEVDISLANVFVADFGIKVFFKDEIYGNPKKPGLQNHLYYEALLLRNYAKLITELTLVNSSNV